MDPSVPPKPASIPAPATQPEARSPAATPLPAATGSVPTQAAYPPAVPAPVPAAPYRSPYTAAPAAPAAPYPTAYAATPPVPGAAYSAPYTAPYPPPYPSPSPVPGAAPYPGPAAVTPAPGVTPAAPSPGPISAATSGNPELHAKIVETLKTIYDPEIPVNLWDMGLIYGIAIEPTGAVGIVMTLTSPWCPEAGTLPPQIESAVKGLPGVTSAKVAIVWEPPWDPSRMSEAARLQLGMM